MGKKGDFGNIENFSKIVLFDQFTITFRAEPNYINLVDV